MSTIETVNSESYEFNLVGTTGGDRILNLHNAVVVNEENLAATRSILANTLMGFLSTVAKEHVVRVQKGYLLVRIIDGKVVLTPNSDPASVEAEAKELLEAQEKAKEAEMPQSEVTENKNGQA